MKTAILLFMGWVLTIAPLSAQKSLPPSIQPYSVNWGYAVKQMFDAAGYHVPGPKAEFDLLPQKGIGSEEAHLDSTVSYFGYDLTGVDSIPLFRNVYTYPEPGVQVIVEYFHEMEAWVPLSLTTLVSDDLGRLVDAFSQRYDSESGLFIPDSRIVLYPRENSLDQVDSFTVLAWSVELGDYVTQLATWNSFDNSGHLVESVSSIEIFEFPLVFKDRYAYDEKGKLVRVESYYVDGSELIPSNKQEFEYLNGFLRTETSLVSDGLGAYTPQSKTDYTYTSFGQKKTVKNYDWNPEKKDWNLVQDDYYGFDTEDRISSLETTHVNKEGERETRQTTYSYVRDNYVAAEFNHVLDYETQEWTTTDKKYFYYNSVVSTEPDEHAVADALFMYPNPTSGIVQVKLIGKVTVQIYTLSGQLVKKFAMAPGEKILDLSGLPAGMYQVRAKSDEDYFSGKLLVL
jgi:hypothetical protein